MTPSVHGHVVVAMETMKEHLEKVRWGDPWEKGDESVVPHVALGGAIVVMGTTLDVTSS